MSRRSSNSTPKLELKLNLSPPRTRNQRAQSPKRPVQSWEMSPESSCMSSESIGTTTTRTTTMNVNYASRSIPESETSMVVLGCPRCLMYVMLSDVDRKCPKCKSTVLLDFSQRRKSQED